MLDKKHIIYTINEKDKMFSLFKFDDRYTCINKHHILYILRNNYISISSKSESVYEDIIDDIKKIKKNELDIHYTLLLERGCYYHPAGFWDDTNEITALTCFRYQGWCNVTIKYQYINYYDDYTTINEIMPDDSFIDIVLSDKGESYTREMEEYLCVEQDTFLCL